MFNQIDFSLVTYAGQSFGLLKSTLPSFLSENPQQNPITG